MKANRLGCVCGVAAGLSVGALADTITHFGNGAGSPDIPALLDQVGIGAANTASESIAEWYVVPGAPGEIVSVRFRFALDVPDPIFGELQFTFGFYLLDAVDAQPGDGLQAYATEALSPQNAVVVFDDRFVSPPALSDVYQLPAGTRLGLFMIPNNTIDAFRADPGSFYIDPNGQGPDEFGRLRSPLFSRADANPGSFDQMLLFASNGVTLGAFEEIARATGFSQLRFNTLAYQILVTRDSVTQPDIVEPPVINPAGVRPTAIASGFFSDAEFPDLAIADAGTNSVLFYRNRRDAIGVPLGTGWQGFEEPESLDAGVDPVDVKADDIDNDGMPDLLVAQRGGNDLILLRGAGGGTFNAPQTVPVGFGQDDVQPGDLDNTKGVGRGVGVFRDLVFVSTADAVIGYLEGIPGAYLPPVLLTVGGTPTQVGIVDLNDDALGDLVWVDPSLGVLSVLLQRPGASPRFDLSDRLDFVSGPEPVSEPVAFVVADLDADGLPDIATVERQTSTVTVHINQGVDDGEWLGFAVTDIVPVGAQPVAISAGRFFGGSLPDLVTADAASDTVAFLRNLGAGQFDVPVPVPMTAGPIDLTVADFNADGIDDLSCVGSPPSMPGMVWTLLGTVPPPPPCPGDVNGDGKVNFHDLMLVLDAFGLSSTGLAEDLNSDGIVNFLDLNLVLNNFGTVCG